MLCFSVCCPTVVGGIGQYSVVWPGRLGRKHHIRKLNTLHCVMSVQGWVPCSENTYYGDLVYLRSGRLVVLALFPVCVGCPTCVVLVLQIHLSVLFPFEVGASCFHFLDPCLNWICLYNIAPPPFWSSYIACLMFSLLHLALSISLHFQIISVSLLLTLSLPLTWFSKSSLFFIHLNILISYLYCLVSLVRAFPELMPHSYTVYAWWRYYIHCYIGNNWYPLVAYYSWYFPIQLSINVWYLFCSNFSHILLILIFWNRSTCFRSSSQSHRIVRFLDRTIGCDWAKVRPIGNVCYDIQQWSHTAIDLYAWSPYHERLENIDDKIHRRKSCD